MKENHTHVSSVLKVTEERITILWLKTLPVKVNQEEILKQAQSSKYIVWSNYWHFTFFS